MEESEKKCMIVLLQETMTKLGMDQRPPMPQDGRSYIWSNEMKSWVDISPKTKHLVTFIRVGRKDG